MTRTIPFLLLFACAPDITDSIYTPPEPECAVSECLAEEEVDAALTFLNHRTTSLGLLDEQVGIDQRAAERIVDFRAGPDGRAGTDDDQRFTHQDELHTLQWLGPVGVDAIVGWAMGAGWPADDAYVGTFDNVGFTVWEADAVLDYINHTDVDDMRSFIDDRAATTIEKARPFLDMDQLSSTWFVGEVTMRRLRDAAL